MNTVPDELIININTSIPGYEKINYKPSMSIKNINANDRNVLFNPLYKLNSKNIGDVSSNDTKKKFFNINSFNSLLNLADNTRVKSLKDAVVKGYINNNIKVTLDAIFSDKSVIYIGNNPYTITDYQWSLGDWKMDKKVTNEQHFIKQIVKDEIISGDEDVFYGNNYTGRKKVKSNTSNIISSVNNPSANTASGIIIPFASASTNVASGINKASTNVASASTNVASASTNVASASTNVASASTNVASGINKAAPEPINKAIVSRNSTNFIRNFFIDRNFYSLINNVYKACDQDRKDLFNKNLNQMSGLNIPNGEIDMNVNAYNGSVNGLKIIANSGGGDCFFIAVADAINNHNYYNQNDRIESGIYGTGSNLFTQSYLRSLVSRFITNWGELDNFLNDIAPINADNLNDLFINQLNAVKKALRDNGDSDDVSEKNYVKIANDIYRANDNFMIKNISSIPFNVDDYEEPFKVLNKSEINNYILSNNYWANEFAINAMCSELRLNVILIQKFNNNKKDLLRIPFANFGNVYNNWNKYLFLFYSDSHYEAISFDYKGLPSSKVNPTKYIFNRDDRQFDPPIYMLFIILGSYFSTIVNITDKNNFTFQKPIIEAMNNIINNRLTAIPNYNANFYAPFKVYFPDSRIARPLIIGGANPNDLYYSRYNNPNYNNNQGYNNNPNYNNNQGYNNNPRYNNYPSQQKSDYAYYVTIDLELYPGTSIKPEDLKDIGCNKKWNSIRKSFSEFTGKPYKPGSINKTKTVNKKQTIPQNTTRKYKN